MEPNHEMNSLNDGASEAARREFRAALSRARAAGLTWHEIVRVLAEHSAVEPSAERPRSTARPKDWPPQSGG
jgi:hypothetical protein